MSRLEIAVTTHHDLETTTPARPVLWLNAFKDAEVTIPLNGPRVGKVTVSLENKAAAIFNSGDDDYLYRLFIRFNGYPILWAPAKTAWDADANTCIITAVDADRLQAHFLRQGDEAIDPANTWDGQVPVDYRGLRLLRDAAKETTEQIARFVAPLGIRNGTNTNTALPQLVKFARSNPVLGSMTGLSDARGGADWELLPLDVDDPAAYPDYMLLKTYNQQGHDYSTGENATVFHCNYGLRNLKNFKADPGKFATHVHVLDAEGKHRVTRYHPDSSRHRGVYVIWVATQIQMPAGAGFETALTAAIASTGATSIDVGRKPPLGFRSREFAIKIDDEILTVTGGRSTTTWTVTRGAQGTTPATHSNGATVKNYTALDMIAEAYIVAYGKPLQAYTIALQPDALQRWTYPTDQGYGVGDLITAGVKRGYFVKEVVARIMQVTLKQTSRLKDTTADLRIIAADRVSSEDIASGEE